MHAARSLLLCVGLSLTSRASHAGPWVRDLGHGYLKAGYSRFAADTFVQPDGSVVRGADYLGQTAHLYGEVGVARSLQAVFNLPFVASRNEVGDVSYINRWGGDLTAGLEYGLAPGGVPVSVQVLGKLPTYDNADLAAYGPSSALFPAIGDGQVDLTMLFAVGHGIQLGRFRGWSSGELGYCHRTEWWLGDRSNPERVYIDGIPWSAQLGWSPQHRERDLGWAFVRASGIHGWSQDAVTQRFTQLSIGGALKLGDTLALEAGYSDLISARNAALGRGLSGGLSASF